MSAAYETDKRRSHDELMDRLKTLSVSAKFEQQESEEEIYTAVNQRPQQEPEEEENVIEIDIDLVEPGYVPATQKEVDEKTLKQAVNNTKIKQTIQPPILSTIL